MRGVIFYLGGKAAFRPLSYRVGLRLRVMSQTPHKAWVTLHPIAGPLEEGSPGEDWHGRETSKRGGRREKLLGKFHISEAEAAWAAVMRSREGANGDQITLGAPGGSLPNLYKERRGPGDGL